MRTGLNVAALGCRGANEAAIIAGYNALLDSQETALAKAHKALVSAAGEARFDDAMTRLDNYWAPPGAQAEFCAAASRDRKSTRLNSSHSCASSMPSSACKKKN